MEIIIEAKKFIFSTLLSSISFRVMEERRRVRQTVDFKLRCG